MAERLNIPEHGDKAHEALEQAGHELNAELKAERERAAAERGPETEIDKLKKLSKTLSNKIIGQDDAIEQVVKSIMRSQAGIGNPNRPLASFLFL